MIRARQYPDEQRRTKRGCPWIAECDIAGTRYTVQSRSGAPYALARILVAAGIPDQTMHLTTQGLKGEMRFRSIHRMAEWTVAESATTPQRWLGGSLDRPRLPRPLIARWPERVPRLPL